MSGHSKWATIKHKKGAADKARAKVFNKIARLLEVAAREGGADASTNAPLRTVIQKAKAAQMTNDAIDRAVKRGAGLSEGGTYESITYEAYAPGGVAMLVDVLTDNRNRSSADVRSTFSKMGGSLAEPGAVGWQFSRRGVVVVQGGDEDGVMMAALDAGADDVADDGTTENGQRAWRITSDPSIVYDVRDALQAAGLEVTSAESTMVSSVTVEVTDAEDARKILRIMDALEELDDVQDVYSNFDISDDLMEAVSA
jgi:YebC/PmpR family DNA-binding regulatory protein